MFASEPSCLRGDTVLSHADQVRMRYPSAEAELSDENEGQPDEWVIVSKRGKDRIVIGRGKSMPDAWAEAAESLFGKRKRSASKGAGTTRRRGPQRKSV